MPIMAMEERDDNCCSDGTLIQIRQGSPSPRGSLRGGFYLILASTLRLDIGENIDVCPGLTRSALSQS